MSVKTLKNETNRFSGISSAVAIFRGSASNGWFFNDSKDVSINRIQLKLKLQSNLNIAPAIEIKLHGNRIVVI